MIQIKNKTFRGTTVVLDGCEFIGCTFIDCMFRWNGGEYKFGDGTAYGGFRGFISENQQIADAVSLLKSLNVLTPEFAASWQRKDAFYVSPTGQNRKAS